MEDGMAEENGDVGHVDHVFRPFSKPPVQGATEVPLVVSQCTRKQYPGKEAIQAIPDEDSESILNQITLLKETNKALAEKSMELAKNNDALTREVMSLARVIAHLQNRIDVLSGT
jgi:FtsZ-binding cell division protein ZapB